MQATTIDDAIITARTIPVLMINHIGIVTSDEFRPLVAQPHFSLAVNAILTAGRYVSIICAVIILNLPLYYLSLLNTYLVCMQVHYLQDCHLSIIKYTLKIMKSKIPESNFFEIVVLENRIRLINLIPNVLWESAS